VVCPLFSAPGQLDRELHRGEQAAGIHVARLGRVGGEVERRAVIDRRANERQPERAASAARSSAVP